MDDWQQRRIETLGAEIVYGPRSQVAHVLDPTYKDSSLYSHDFVSAAFCGLWSWSRSGWLGLGSYQEWEKGRRMPLCLNCLRGMKSRGYYGYRNTPTAVP